MSYIKLVRRVFDNERIRDLFDKLRVPDDDRPYSERLLEALDGRTGENERVRKRLDELLTEYTRNTPAVRTEYEEGVGYVLSKLQEALDNPDS